MDATGSERLDTSLLAGGNVPDSTIRSLWYRHENYSPYSPLRISWESWLSTEESGFRIFVVSRNFSDTFRGTEGSEFKRSHV